MAKDLTKGDEFFNDSDMTMIMMMVMMAAIMSQFISPIAQAQAQMIQTQAYTGVEDPRKLRAIHLLQWIDLAHDEPFTPWISAYFINDGPNTVEIGINFPDDRFEIMVGETITVTRSGAEERINIIFYTCRSGRANVRVTGVY